MYVTAALLIALVATGAIRIIASTWEWNPTTWALTFAVSLVTTLVTLYVIGLTSRARTERHAFGPGPPPLDPSDDPARHD